MKNILLMVPRLNMGGAETYTYQLAKLLKYRGYNVVVASGGGALSADLKKFGIATAYLPMRLSTSLAAFWLRFIVKKYKIDLIHANSSAAGITAVKYARHRNIPVIFTAHGVVSGEEASYLRHCTEIIAVSDFLKEQLISQKIPAEKITRIYTGIDTRHFDPDKVKGISKIDFKIPLQAFTMIQIARVRNLRNKGHEIILDIMANYTFARDWHLIVVGEGSGFHKLQNAVKHLKLEHRVHLVGQQNHVEAYTKTADVVVSPSRFETFGLALAEGMAMAKPGVAFDVGGVKEIIKPGETGYLSAYPNAHEFAEALYKLAQDPVAAKAMGLAAREDIINRFPVQGMIQEILKIYERGLLIAK